MEDSIATSAIRKDEQADRKDLSEAEEVSEEEDGITNLISRYLSKTLKQSQLFEDCFSLKIFLFTPTFAIYVYSYRVYINSISQ